MGGSQDESRRVGAIADHQFVDDVLNLLTVLAHHADKLHSAGEKLFD